MELSTTLQTNSPTDVYRLSRLAMNDISPSVLSEWNRLLELNPSTSPLHDPRWLQERFGQEKNNLAVYFLYRGDSLCGFAPFLTRDWPLKCQLGEVTLARLPLRRLCLLGGALLFPEDPAAHELLFRELLSRDPDFDALYLEDVPVDSFLWKFAGSNHAVSSRFSGYVPDPPAPRVLLRLSDTFDDYMGKFSAKHRKNLRRSIRLFQETAPGDVETVRFTRPDQVDAFVAQAAEISRKTYQWNLLGLGLRSAEETKRYLSFLAHNGWLRCYLLLRKDTACAFVIGFQYGSRYYLDDMGYDPAWREYSVGKILQLEIVQDLFACNRPEVYDLGEYGAHKEELGTETYAQGKMLLFRRGAYTGIVRAGHRGCQGGTRIASTLLSRFGLKKRLKKIIRMWSSQS